VFSEICPYGQGNLGKFSGHKGEKFGFEMFY